MSRDFYDKPVNTRIINIFELKPPEELPEATRLFKERLNQYYNDSKNYQGKLDNIFGLEKISLFIAKKFWNPEKIDRYPKVESQF